MLDFYDTQIKPLNDDLKRLLDEGTIYFWDNKALVSRPKKIHVKTIPTTSKVYVRVGDSHYQDQFDNPWDAPLEPEMINDLDVPVKDFGEVPF